MTKRFTALTMACAVVWAAQSLLAQRPASSAPATLAGTWTLASVEHTPSGFVGVHFVPLNRKRFAADTPTDEEARAAIAGYVGYYGALTVYPGLVFHHRLAMLGPAQGDTLTRFAEVEGSEIHVKFPPTMNQGQEVTTLVTLKRLSGEAEMLGTAAK